MIRSGGCPCGGLMNRCSNPRSPISIMSAAVRAGRSPPRCSCAALSPRHPGCTSICSRGRRRQGRAGPKAVNVRLRALSMPCSRRVMADPPPPPFDRRITPWRDEVAAKHLEGKVKAARFVDGRVMELIASEAPLRHEPRPDARLDTEALKGERATVYDANAEGWSWGQLEDG